MTGLAGSRKDGPSPPTVWFLTHDGHGGGRIFSPLAALARLGCLTHIFHHVALPDGLAASETLTVPALERRVVGIRAVPVAGCSFASLRRLVDRIREHRSALLGASGLVELGGGWQGYGRTIGPEAFVFAFNPDYPADLTKWLCYREETGTLFYSNAEATAAARTMLVLRCLQALSAQAVAVTPADLLRCVEPEAPAPIHSGGWMFRIGGVGLYDAASGALCDDTGRIAWHVLPPAPAPIDEEWLALLRLVWPGYDLTVGAPGLRAESHAVFEGKGKQPDLILVADLPLLPQALALKRSWGVPVVLDAHEWWAEQERTWHPEAPHRAEALDRLERLLYPLCDRRFTVGHQLAGAMEGRCGVPFDVLHTVADLGRMPERSADRDAFWRERAGLPAGARVAVFCGNLTANRNLEVLAEATACLHTDQLLIVIGDGPYRAELAAAVALRVPERLVLLGEQPFTTSLELIANADVAVIPYDPAQTPNPPYLSLFMPSKFSDYLATRTPVLVHAGLRECAGLVTAYGTGRVWGQDGANDFGPVLAEMLADSEGAASMRKAHDLFPDLFSHRQLEWTLGTLLSELVRR